MFRRILAIFPILLLGGAAIVLFFINLSGVQTLGVLMNVYFSEVESPEGDISEVIPSDGKAKWYLYRVCTSERDGSDTSCTGTQAAMPYSPSDNFGSTRTIPYFNRNRNSYYYGTRIAYGFIVAALAFTVLAFLCQLLSPIFITTLGPAAAFLSIFALVTDCVGLSLIIAYHTRGVNAWKDLGFSANVGVASFVLLGLSMALLLLSTLFSCCVASARHKNRGYEQPAVAPPVGPPVGGHPYPASNSYSEESYRK